MNALWITLTLLTAGFVGWPVTALVFRLARTIDDRQDAGAGAADPANDPAADATADPIAATGTASGAVGAVDAAGTPGAAAGSAALPVSSVRILRGGAIIGVLERLAVCLAILAGEPVAIAPNKGRP